MYAKNSIQWGCAETSGLDVCGKQYTTELCEVERANVCKKQYTMGFYGGEWVNVREKPITMCRREGA